MAPQHTLKRINPASLFPPPGGKHAHVVLAPAQQRLAFIAGQVAFDRNGQLIGVGDVHKQSEQCFANLRDALASINAEPEHIIKMTIFVRDYRPEMLTLVDQGGQAIFGARWPVTATTLIGVQALGMADFLVEIEAIAVLPP